jgi:hypothetical protein
MEELKEVVVKINGVPVTQQELEEKKKDKNIRLIQEDEHSYRILTRMVE